MGAGRAPSIWHPSWGTVALGLIVLSVCVGVRADQQQVHNGLMRQGYGEMMSMSGIRGLSCRASVTDFFTVNLAAVSLSQYPNACGKCLTLRCLDKILCEASPKSSVVVGIVDNCADCGADTVVVGSFVASQLTGSALSSNGTIPVSWQFTNCSSVGQINVTNVVSKTEPTPPPLSPPVHAPHVPVAPLLLLSSFKNNAPAAEVVSNVPPTNLTANASASEIRAVPVAEYAGSTARIASVNASQPAAETLLTSATVLVQAPAPEAEVQTVLAAPVRGSTPSAPAPEPEVLVLPAVNVPSSPSSELVQPPIPPTMDQSTTLAGDGGLSQSSNMTLTGRAYPAYYKPFPQDSFSSLACGFGRVSSYFQDHFAGVSLSTWQESSPACGSCIAVKCSNATQCPNGMQVTVQIADSCGSCNNGDINLSPTAFRKVVGEAQQAVSVSWSPVSCRNHTNGTIYLWVGSGDTVYWRQVTFGNAAQPVVAASINGDQLQHGPDDRWIWQNSGHPLNQSVPLMLQITGADGKSETTSLSSFSSQLLPIQL